MPLSTNGRALPSQTPTRQRDESYEAGFYFGRTSALSAVAHALANGATLSDIADLVENMNNERFERVSV